MAERIDYRILSDPADFERVVDLEIQVWGLDPRDAVPASMLRALEHGGGLVNAAFADDEMVGMSVMYPIPIEKRLILWSHMAGVHPDMQQYGIGRGLKLHQRRWALEHGYDEIRWTFDPLQRGNANFNLHKLGATFDTYHINFYGVMTDAINAGLPSDRVEAMWRLNDERVIVLANGEHPPQHIKHPMLMVQGEGGEPQILDSADGTTPAYMVQLPATLKVLDSSSMLAWRLALRETLTSAFAAGYFADDFRTHESAYILHKRHPRNSLHVTFA